MSLNQVQVAVVNHLNGPLLVLAGAGSGKTTVLTHRVAKLVDKIPSERILLLTFTRKAAQEMLDRVAKLTSKNSQVSGGTFHSFCSRVLRRYASEIGYDSNFTLMDSSDSISICEMIRSKLFKGDKYAPSKYVIQDVYSKSANWNLSPHEVLERWFMDSLVYWSDLEKAVDHYIRYKKKHQLMDYDDLLTLTYTLFLERSDIQRNLSRYFQYVMIDEYQDTNVIQAEISYLLAKEHENLVVVGDDNQSVYSFRGANYENILNFPKRYPNCKIVKLEQNYRSTQPLLDFSNAIPKNTKLGYNKTLFSTIKTGQKPQLVVTPNNEQEARYVVDRIQDLLAAKAKPEEIAVLFRSSYSSTDVETTLASECLRYVKFGGSRFLDSSVVKNVLALLRLALNRKDTLAWYRILTLFPGLGAVKANKLLTEIVKTGSLECLTQQPNKNYTDHLLKLHSMLRNIRGKMSCENKVASAVTLYQDLVQVSTKDSYKLDQLVKIAGRYSKLKKFVTDLALEDSDDTDVQGAVVLSTIHSSKGKEWDHVFIIQLTEGSLPSCYYAIAKEEELEEERRLFYVAATRARKSLTMTVPVDKRVPSRFLLEMELPVLTKTDINTREILARRIEPNF